MTRKVVDTEKAPKAIGPYSQACCFGVSKTIYLSGQVPLDPRTNELIKGTISEQAARCMQNLKAILNAADLDFDHVVRCTIYLLDMNDFAAVNQEYAKCFSGPPPARACIQVAGLPKGARVEIDAIAEYDT